MRGMGAHAELIHIGLADDHCTRILQERHHGRIVGAREVL